MGDRRGCSGPIRRETTNLVMDGGDKKQPSDAARFLNLLRSPAGPSIFGLAKLQGLRMS
jgi:hypothetical protein